MAGRNNWTEEQITVVLYGYCRKPFGQFFAKKDFVRELAALIGRTPDAVVRKVGNLASFDPKMKSRGVGGLVHTGKLDEVIWNRYYGNWEKLAYDAEVLLASFRKIGFEESLSVNLDNLPAGEERIQEIRRRINQDFFRETVLASYNQRCCITGLKNPLLLQASHIVGWNIDKANRTNPENGLCLNSLFHKAYDDNLIGISPDYEILISEEFFGESLSKVPENTREYIMGFNHKKIILPRRFLPNRDLLAQHYDFFCHNVV